jgi:Holliday junction resolvase-like predicted endonuclease
VDIIAQKEAILAVIEVKNEIITRVWPTTRLCETKKNTITNQGN